MSFTQLLQKEVKPLAESFSIPESKAFALWFAKLEIDIDDDEAFDAISVEGSNEKGMDVFHVDPMNQRVVIAQCKYSPDCSHSPKMKDVDTLLSCFDWLASPQNLASEGRRELVAAAEDYRDAVEKGYSVQVWFVYCGLHDANIEKRIRVFNANKDNFDKNRRAIHCDSHLFQMIYEETEGQSRRIPLGQIKVASGKLEMKGAYGKGLLTTISGPELVSLYDEFGDELFARNVRGWLGARKGSVNAVMIDTVGTEAERGRFWAYNNGITIVCDKFKHSRGRLSLWNFSIVNGCQTTIALVHSRNSGLTSQVTLLARIICPPREIIDSIIRFTNSQNLIRRWDLVSQDVTQKRLQAEFGKLREPIYYILRRGDWRSLEQSERSRYKDKINHDLLAQYLASFNGIPVAAYKEKGLLFDKYYDLVFPADLRVEESLFIWRAGERVQDLVREEIREENARIQKGEKGREKYLLILKRGGRFFALSVFAWVAYLRNGLDYRRSITEDRITSNNGKERIDKYAKYAVQSYRQTMGTLLESAGQDLSVLIRSGKFAETLKENVDNTYNLMSVNEEWLKGALPKLQ